MSPSITLLMAIHCHQPVGNFDFVFEEAYAKAYDPFLQVLERHPGVRLALHYSGCLLDWLQAHRPAFLKRIAALVTRGQIELLASGYYEPLLPLLPEADRQGQIAKMRSALRRLGERDAVGLWLTERVWEPELPQTLAQAGIHYTMLDTNQFHATKPWLPSALQFQDDAFWDVFGSYTTDYAGASVRVFPASKRLRYWMPFQPADRTIQFLRSLKQDRPLAMTFADDGEKFGLWPNTFHWVYEEGWLDQLFSALEREQGWLTTSTFREYAQRTAPDGRVALPSGSYEEMLEWSGGHFRNFLTKYSEAHDMERYMLRISRQLQEVERNSQLSTRNSRLVNRAREELYAGQCNCAYWHGVFGGLYLSHLRRAVYRHLITAEQLLRQAGGTSSGMEGIDVDGDGQEETILSTPAMSITVDPDEGGAITQWNLYGARVNLLDTLSRRHEPYHEKLRSPQTVAAEVGGRAPASIHDILGVKEENLASYLVYDDHRRSAFLDYAFRSQPTLQEIVHSTAPERRVWVGGPCRQHTRRTTPSPKRTLSVECIRQLPGGTIKKRVLLHTNRPVLECHYTIEGLDVPVIGLEFNIGVRDERYLREPGELRHVSAFDLAEPSAGILLRVICDPPATVFHVPVETVSESEEGLERTYQGLCVVLCWAPEALRRWTGRVHWTLQEPRV